MKYYLTDEGLLKSSLSFVFYSVALTVQKHVVKQSQRPSNFRKKILRKQGLDSHAWRKCYGQWQATENTKR
nr:MAG TPA: hypothetical protein [Caudoviricetes sp.]